GCSLSTSALFVHPKGTLSACCGSQDSPCGSLEAALARASDNATVTLASGTYTRTASPPSAPILLPPLLALTILGPALPSPPAVLDCNGGPCLVASCQSIPAAGNGSGGSNSSSGSGGRWCGQQQPVLVVKHLSVLNGVTTGSGGCLLLDGYRAVL
ncbi:unnamed protein product, partial [Closterium sp. NIES-54]